MLVRLTSAPNFGTALAPLIGRAMLVALVCIALALSLAGLPPASGEEPDPGAAPDAATLTDELTRPDAISAMTTAQATGERVEDEAQRDELSRVFANPDGTWTAETASEPERVIDSEGVWHDIDTTLVERDGRIEPLWSAADVSLSDGGDRTFVSLEERGKDLAWKWATDLPAPSVEGSTATYVGVAPGDGDLVVTALASGFSYDVVLNERPTEPLTLTTPVLTDGAYLDTTPGGGLDVTLDSGVTVASAPAPLMWDAATDVEGEPVNIAEVSTSVTDTAQGGRLVLTPEASFLNDPATTYPVTVDPSFTTYTTGDMWIENVENTTAQAGSEELRVGSENGGTRVARTYLDFNTTAWAGKKVTNATLRFWNFYSGSCASGAIRASAITSEWRTSDLRWANQPSVSSSLWDDYSPAFGGGSNCAANHADFNVTSVVDAWASGTANHGLRVKAVDETSNNTRRKYRSVNYNYTGAGTQRPRLLVTYNSYPRTPSLPTLAPGNAGFSRTRGPIFQAGVSDPDGGSVAANLQVRNGSGTQVWSGTSAMTASGGTAKVDMADVLTEGQTYTVRSRTHDGTLYSAWSPDYTFKVDGTSPPVPAITGSLHQDGQWLQSAPAGNTFSLTGAADNVSYLYSQDGGAWKSLPAAASGAASLAWNPSSGHHTLAVKASDGAGNVSAEKSFSFGVGGLAIQAPDAGARSTRTFPLTITGKPDAVAAKLQWRYSGQLGASTWVDATELTTESGAPWNGSAPNDSAGQAAIVQGVMWSPQGEAPLAGSSESVRAPALLEIRGCFDYATTPTQICSPGRSVQLVPSGFGDNMPTTSVGPAEVALTTGELAVGQGDAADATVGVGRMFASFDDATVTNGVFGLGWSSVLSDSMTDTASATLTDHRDDVSGGAGPFVLQYPDGSTETFRTVDQGGEYLPVDTAEGASTRRITFTAGSSGAPDTVELTEDQGARTLWNNATGAWLPQTVDGIEDSGSTRFDWNSEGNLTWIAQNTSSGVVCNPSTQHVGCRAIRIVYTGSGPEVRVSSVQQVAYDPAPNASGAPGSSAGMRTTTVATYEYSAGQLTKVCDPRPAVSLCTSYSYASASGRTMLASVTPPGQASWRFSYDAEGRLATVKRSLDSSTTSETGDAVWTVVYDIDLETIGLPDVSAGAAAQWGQMQLPAKVTALFQPSRVPSGSPGAMDWPHAALWYATESGTTTNTAVYGDEQWLLDTLWYDDHGNVVQQLDAAGRSRALAENVPALQPLAAWKASMLTTYASDGAAATHVVDKYGPAKTTIRADGSESMLRSHVKYVYDGDPAGLDIDPNRPALPEGENSFGQVVEEARSAAEADLSADYDTRRTRYEFSPNVAGDSNGWILGLTTRTKRETETGWSTTFTRHNDAGQIVEKRRHGGATNSVGAGSDARTTAFVYYSGDASAIDPECRSGPAWEGLICRAGPAAQPNGANVPVTYTTGYNADQQPTRTEDRSGATIRTTVNSYDNAGRVVSSGVSVVGGPSNDPSLATTSYGYESATGLHTSTSAGADSVVAEYDSWGRQSGYADEFGNTSGSTFTRNGEVETFFDGAGTYTYTYDSSAERRRLPTTIDVGLPSGSDTFTLSYDSRGEPSTISYPSGLVAHRSYNEVGVPVSLDYVDGDEVPILAFSAGMDSMDRVASYSSAASRQKFSFDMLDRLQEAESLTSDGGCEVRQYGFNAASARSSYKSFEAGVDGNCQRTSSTTTLDNTFDSAGRIVNAGYSYDNLGRTRTIPQGDTAVGGVGAMTQTYYPNNLMASATQSRTLADGRVASESVSYGLDPTHRVTEVSMQSDLATSSTTRYKFSAEGDFPTSVSKTEDGGSTWESTRYVQVPTVGLVAAVSGSSAMWQLSNLHGDIVATSAASTPQTVTSYSETDEFGRTNGQESGRYGWLGADQRSTDAIGGMILMGVRAYNPTTGMFLTPDPILDGGSTPYDYANADPVNNRDITGLQTVFGPWHYEGGSYTYSNWHALVGIWTQTRNIRRVQYWSRFLYDSKTGRWEARQFKEKRTYYVQFRRVGIVTQPQRINVEFDGWTSRR